MKQLTKSEFDALPSDRPLDVRTDGVPPEETEVQLWIHGRWDKVYQGLMYKNYWSNIESQISSEYFIKDHPIYHKLPAPYLEKIGL